MKLLNYLLKKIKLNNFIKTNAIEKYCSFQSVISFLYPKIFMEKNCLFLQKKVRKRLFDIIRLKKN